MKYMKWGDLQVGDKVKISEDFKKEVIDRGGLFNFTRSVYNNTDILCIKEIDIKYNHLGLMTFYFKEFKVGLTTFLNGSGWRNSNILMLEIIELKEE